VIFCTERVSAVFKISSSALPKALTHGHDGKPTSRIGNLLKRLNRRYAKRAASLSRFWLPSELEVVK
jgi:hypothetical protein